MIKVSLIVTVLNETDTIVQLLDSVVTQTLKPQEVIFVDGGSQDDTVRRIQSYAEDHPKLKIKCEVKKGNRSIGRNTAVSLAEHEFIAITDAGCVLDQNWLQELVRVQNETGSKVVAGYYHGQAETSFQHAVVPYVLVMPEKLDPYTFLPATRSLLIEKKLFIEYGGFDESLSDNEDYAFAKKLQSAHVPIAFAQDAIVYWQAVNSLREFYTMIFRFARGDAFAGIFRPKVLLIFLRYLVGILLLIIGQAWVFISLVMAYLIWSVLKNSKHVFEKKYILAILQIVSDIAVIDGTTRGLILRIKKVEAV